MSNSIKSILKKIPFVSWLVKQRNLNRKVKYLEESIGRINLDMYIRSIPDVNNALSLFNGEWSSRLPGYGYGESLLFEDSRVKWFMEMAGGLAGKSVLELGPLEAGHTYMMSNAGASSITCIESNARAFMKCLLIKHVYDIKANFLLGDFVLYLNEAKEKYDFVLASGVLYHMEDPVGLLESCAKVSRSIGIWTHYYDDSVIALSPELSKKFDDGIECIDRRGRSSILYKQKYLDALSLVGFCGAGSVGSTWLRKEDIIGILEDLGFKVDVGEDHKNHPHGPCMTLFAHCHD